LSDKYTPITEYYQFSYSAAKYFGKIPVVTLTAGKKGKKKRIRN
jgi:hypothetical protein